MMEAVAMMGGFIDFAVNLGFLICTYCRCSIYYDYRRVFCVLGPGYLWE